MHTILVEHLRLHTGKLFGTWLLGMATWLTEWLTQATNVVGFLGALVGLLAGVMLVVIRWDDFVNSKVILRLRRLLSKLRP
jgi:thiol:disulfide interchange protein